MFNPSDENATSSRNSDKTGTVNKFFLGEGGKGMESENIVQSGPTKARTPVAFV